MEKGAKKALFMEKVRRVGIYLVDTKKTDFVVFRINVRKLSVSTMSEEDYQAINEELSKDESLKPSQRDLFEKADAHGFVYVLHIGCKSSTYDFRFSIDDFICGWNKDAPKKGWHRMGEYSKARIDGAIEEMAKRNGGFLEDEVEYAFRNYRINPSFLRKCGKATQRSVKWAQKRPMNWGGARKGAGRKPKESLLGEYGE